MPWAVYPANCRSPRTRANSGELERTRANSARIRHRFANTDTPPNSGERSPEYAERSPEFGGVRPGSPVLRRELANGSPENSFAGRNTSISNERSPRTSPPRTQFAANVKFGERVRQKFLGNGHNSLLPRTSSPLANKCSPRTIVRREQVPARNNERTRNYDLRNSVRS